MAQGSAAGPTANAASTLAEARTDEQTNAVLLDMHQAFRRGDKRRLAQLLPQTRGHLLEPWAAYWELRARLDEATPQQVQDFLTRWAGTYHEDRLRNDWLLVLGQRREWQAFVREHALFRMNDDREVRCYAALVQHWGLVNTPPRATPAADVVRANWFALRDADDGCTLAAKHLIADRQMPALDAWRKARMAIEANRPRAAAEAVETVAPKAAAAVAELQASPTKFLTNRVTAFTQVRRELITLALIRLAATDLDGAIRQLDGKWGPQLSAEERHWVWGVIGKLAAQRLDARALEHFAQVGRLADLNDDMLGWMARAALRAGNTPRWSTVFDAIRAMSPAARQDPTWVYWRARSLMAPGQGEAHRAEALAALQSIASTRGFYEQLALEDTGQRITAPARPAPLTDAELDAARRHPGLQRALHAIAIGLRPDGVREWNYTTNLATPGGMPDRELLAAAQVACEREVWDRCINTSERSRNEIDVAQRFPMPFREQVVARSREIGLDPSYVYGLIRQESRFIMNARSHVGASGLMQVMPATARWTARKIGLNGFTPEQINDRDTNIAIGTGYLKLVLDDFAGSMPLAAAAYNAGPSRPRNWRAPGGSGPVLEGAIWAENVPFNETRDYVKKVLSNATVYAAILSGQPQSLKARLGTVGPRDTSQPEPNKDLP
ncbi:MAG: transglycosylase SLT domain-containing protein [Burkholderiaceae bacterium]